MTDRQRRSEKLVNGIRAALERGVSPDRIHAELVRRNLPPEKATLLLDRILSTMAGPMSVEPAPSDSSDAHRGGVPALASAGTPRQVRRGRTPFFLALGISFLVCGCAGVYLTSRESGSERAAVLAARLDGEVTAAREHLSLLESRIEARKVDAAQIEWLRARVARGPGSYQNPGDYRAAVARYQRRRAAWNRTLTDYQVVAQAFRTLADIHNAKLDSLDLLTHGMETAQGPGAVRTVRRTRIAASTDPMQD